MLLEKTLSLQNVCKNLSGIQNSWVVSTLIFTILSPKCQCSEQSQRKYFEARVANIQITVLSPPKALIWCLFSQAFRHAQSLGGGGRVLGEPLTCAEQAQRVLTLFFRTKNPKVHTLIRTIPSNLLPYFSTQGKLLAYVAAGPRIV